MAPNDAAGVSIPTTPCNTPDQPSAAPTARLLSGLLGLSWDPFDEIDMIIADHAASQAAFMEQLGMGFNAVAHISLQIAQLHPAVAIAVSVHNLASGQATWWDLAAIIPGGRAGAMFARAGGSFGTTSAAYASRAAGRGLGSRATQATGQIGAIGARLTAALNRGPRDTYVYLGYRGGMHPVYVGITNNIRHRKAQHQRKKGSDFTIRRITGRLTRMQAKAIETLIIIRNPHFENHDRSIATNNPIFKKAMKWAGKWVQKHGIPIDYW